VLADLVRVEELPEIRLNPKETPPEVYVRPVVGGAPEAVMTLDEFRGEWPILKTAFLMAAELFEATNPGSTADLGIGPTFDELLELCRRYLDSRVTPQKVGNLTSNLRDVGIYFWRRQALDVARLRALAEIPVDRNRRGRQAGPHKQGALPYGPGKAIC